MAAREGTGGTHGFREPYSTYARTHRSVFLEEILRFTATANRQELAGLRKEVQARRQALRRGKRGRPRGSTLRGMHEERQPSESEKREQEQLSEVCIVCLDFPDLRSAFLQQILTFVQESDRPELTAIRKAIVRRVKSPGLRMKRGRPNATDDDELMYRARQAAWLHTVERKPWKEIALAQDLPWDEGNEEQRKNVRWTLQRREEYLAATLWRVVPPNYVVQYGGRKANFKPGALDNKTLQGLIRFHTGLPFMTHPEQCKQIIQALWPRAWAAAFRDLKGDLRYARAKRVQSS